MNILLWILQILLALHTSMGAMWKFSNSEQMFASLTVIPHSLWLTMSVIELVCSVVLVFPLFNKRWAFLAPLAALYIVAEMLLFSGLEAFSAVPAYSSIRYWLVVAAISAFIAYGRFVLKPFNRSKK